MIDAPLAYAFGVGMVATFNPCGFAMLPAYLSYFLGLEGANQDAPRASVMRALAVGATTAAGFILVFGLLGVVLKPTLDTVQEKLPWVTIVLGVGLVALGIYMLTGRSFTVNLPKLTKGTNSRELSSVFLFGVSYAIVSLSCTIGVFIAVVSTTMESANFVSGVAVFLAYGAGMGLVLMVLTMAIALARQGLVRSLRRILPYINRISGVLLVLAGVYVSYYGWYELRVRSGDVTGGGPAKFVSDLSSRLSNWIQDVGPPRIGLVLGAVIVGAVLIAVAARYSSPSHTDRTHDAEPRH